MGKSDFHVALAVRIVKFALVAISFSIRATYRSKDGWTDRTAALAFVGHSDFYFTLAARIFQLTLVVVGCAVGATHWHVDLRAHLGTFFLSRAFCSRPHKFFSWPLAAVVGGVETWHGFS